MTFLLDEDSIEVEGLLCDDLHRDSMVRGSRALLDALRLGRADIWPCGHDRSPRNTQRVRHVERCRECRRARWIRGFRIVVVRRQIAHAAAEIMQRAEEGRRNPMAEAAVRRMDEARIPADQVIGRTARAFGMRKADIIGKRREGRYIDARATVAMILHHRGLSYPIIGRLLGGRDHSTIMNLCRKFEIYARRNPVVMRTFNTLRDRPC